jgi:hypothetical protein
MAAPTSASIKEGIWKGAGVRPAAFPIHTVPDIKKDSIIVGLCGAPSIEVAVEEDGWFLSDFYAFNYLLHPVSASQNWLTSVNPTKYLKTQGSNKLLHGNPYETRKVVLSQDLMKSGELTPPKIFGPEVLLSKFLDCVAFSANEARQKKLPLVVFILAHGNTEHKILIGEDSDTPLWLDVREFRDKVGDDVDLTIICTSCYGGGWLVFPSLTATAMFAADTENESSSWPLSETLSRACGSVFASTLIHTLAQEASPLLEPVPNTGTKSLEPKKDDPKAETFHAFAQSIMEVLMHRMDRMWEHHYFTFTAQDDQWESSWTGRSGIPLTDFGARWALLEDFAPTMKRNEDGVLIKETPKNRNPRISLNPEIPDVMEGRTGAIGLRYGAFGGYPSSQAAYVKFCAKSLLPTCPGIVESGFGGQYIGKIRRFINKPNKDITSEESMKMFKWILWREDQLTWADNIVAHLRLPMPDGKKVRNWDKLEWGYRNRNLREKTALPWTLLNEAKIFPQTDPEAFPYTYRPQDYVQAALALGCKSKEEMEEKVRAMAKLRDDIVKADEILGKTMRIEDVRNQATPFFTNIGRRLRDLSPLRKRRRTITAQAGPARESYILRPRADRGRSDSDPSKRRSDDMGRPERGRGHRSRFSMG